MRRLHAFLRVEKQPVHVHPVTVLRMRSRATGLGLASASGWAKEGANYCPSFGLQAQASQLRQAEATQRHPRVRYCFNIMTTQKTELFGQGRDQAFGRSLRFLVLWSQHVPTAT